MFVMRARHWLVLLATVALAYACGSRTHVFPMATAASSDARRSSEGATPDLTDTGPASSALTSATEVTVLNDDVHFVVTVTNNTAKKIELTFPDGKTHDVSVHDAAGSEIWRWSSGQMFTQSLRNKPLAPHATLSYAMNWRRPLVHGPLVAVGTLTSTNYPVASRATFVLP
jgi:hypothetical protein